MDTNILEDLGLTSAEIKVYISLLEIGSTTAGQVLEKSRLQNSVVHRALNSLIEKGIISFIAQGKRKIYHASEPEHFNDFIDEKKRRFNEILPELKLKQAFAKKTTFGEIFKDRRGINQMYMTLLDAKGDEYNTFGGGSEVTYTVMGESWWKNFHLKRIERKIRCRQVFDETIKKFGVELNKKPLTKIKFLSKEYAQLQETIIRGDYVGIAIFTENPYGILIKDAEVAKGYRKQFEVLWQKAKS
ncbi:MAG: helix-turn-helix domain-containing protein [Candidatus Woesearchaeota archaeon]|jgi:sugar-specific transcriptional regulator TrmB